MLGRLVEKMKGGGKCVSGASYLGGYLDRVCSRYAGRYLSMKAQNEDTDALDILAQMLISEMGTEEVDTSAARAFLSILIENDHLPMQCQLNESELGTLRDLLLGYFSGAANINDKGAQVLSLIERKFGNGDFSQAKILLQIFETNEETRQNNERNLYYEEMIIRLDMGPTRPKAVGSGGAVPKLSSTASEEEAVRYFQGLVNEGGIRFYLYLRDLEEVSRWQNALSSLHAGVQEYLLDYIPVIRWRMIGMLEEPLMAQIGRHMTFEMLRRHVQSKLRMCYFLLLASGCTGHEWFIFSFTEWSKKHFDVDVREVFPVLHRSGVVEGMCLQEVLDIVTDRFYGNAMNRIVVRPDALEEAYHSALQTISESDFGQVPSGNYSLGDFILDALLPFDYASPAFAYRLYAMM